MDEIKQIDCVAVPQGYTYHFDLNCPIEDPGQFSNFFTILREASPDDIVFIHINSPGGSLDTTVQILNAMNTTKSTIVTSAEGMVASGAAVIFFSGHAFQIAEHCEFLIHTASGGNAGKISDNLTSVRFSVERLKHLYETVLGGFLKEEELEWIARGEEFFLTSEQVTERINTFIEEQQEEKEESE